MELLEHRYRPGPYASFTIHEPKRRLISAAPFRDRVVHHALCQLIEPAFERSFIEHSYANRVGKGTHRALDTCQRWAQRYRYALGCDIRQFFPSIDHSLLQRTLNRRIQDGDMRRLIGIILESGVGVLSEDYDMVYFPGDDLFAANRPRGLPIGNLTSQFWANCYMSSFDHFVNRELGCPAYLRYVDDMLFFSDDASQLRDWRSAIISGWRPCASRCTRVAPRCSPAPAASPSWASSSILTHRLLKRRKGIAYRRRLRSMLQSYRRTRQGKDAIAGSLLGWINHVRYGDTWGLRRAILKDVIL